MARPPSATASPLRSFSIGPAVFPADLTIITNLFEAYAFSLGIDLSFQDFSTELTTLPGRYAPPTGTILLARSTSDHRPLGCVALRALSASPTRPTSSLDDRLAEMKRLYVSPSGRGTGVGVALAEAVITEARRLGYSAIRLDTLSSMTTAMKIYQRLGFKKIEAYYETPLEETTFLELRLD